MSACLEVDWVEAPCQRSWWICDVSVKVPAATPVHNDPNSHHDNDEDKDGHHQAGIQGHIPGSLQYWGREED